MMRYGVLIGVLFVLATTAHASKQIYGQIVDIETGEGIALASVRIYNTLSGTIANDDGLFRLTLWQLPAVVAVTHVSYKTQQFVVSEQTEDFQLIKLVRRAYELDEIVVLSHPYLRQFTFEGGNDGDWSSDGQHIAFVSGRSGFPEIWVKPVSGAAAIQYTHQQTWVCSPAWSPDGIHLGFVSELGGALNVWVMPSKGGEPRSVTVDSDHVHDGRISKATRRAVFSWSPDGKEIVFARRGEDTFSQSFRYLHGDWRIPVTGGTAVPVTNESGRFSAPLWSPDGTQLAFTERGAIAAASLSNGKRLQKIKKIGQRLKGAHYASGWSPDSKWLAFSGDSEASRGSDMWVVRVKDQKVVRLSDTPTRRESHPRWSPDGKSLLFSLASAGYDLWVMPAAGGKPVRVAECVETADWSPDGKEIGFVAYTDDGKDIFRMPAQGGEWQPVTSGGNVDGWRAGLSWSPDGNTFAVISNRSPLDWEEGLDLWTMPVNDGRPKVIYHYRSDYWHAEYRPRWSPDGKQIIFAHIIGIVVASSSGEELRSRKLTSNAGSKAGRFWGSDLEAVALTGESEPVWSPDGKWLAFTVTETQTFEDRPSVVFQSIWIAPDSGGTPRRLITGCSPEWSPDGKDILFVPEWSPENSFSELYKESRNKGDNALRSLWKMPVEGGEATEILKQIRGLRDARWSPDGQSILFLATPESNLWMMDLSGTKFKSYLE